MSEKKQPETERRAYAAELRTEGDAGKIVGYAAVFNSKSEDLGFREIVMPGAFDRSMREAHDVRALVNHDSNLILGRTKSGTLKLSVDERGLKAEIDPPDTQSARDALASIKRGDMDGMSFAFRTLTDDWRMEDGELVRELRDLELVDVSVVAFPAYAATSVSARALEHAKAAKEAAAALPVPPPATPSGVPNELNAARLGLLAR